MHDHRYVRDTVKSPSPRHAAAIANRIGDAKSPSPRQNLPPNLTPLRNPISPWDSECALHLKKNLQCAPVAHTPPPTLVRRRLAPRL